MLIVNTVGVDETNFDVTITTTLRSDSSIDGLNANQTRVGDNLVELLSNGDLDSGLADFIVGVGAISDVGELGAALNDLSPERFDASPRFLAQSQHRFMADMALRAAPVGDGSYV